MARKNSSNEHESAHVLEIRGTGPKERPPMPKGLLKPPGANPQSEAHEPSKSASEEG